MLTLSFVWDCQQPQERVVAVPPQPQPQLEEPSPIPQKRESSSSQISVSQELQPSPLSMTSSNTRIHVKLEPPKLPNISLYPPTTYFDAMHRYFIIRNGRKSCAYSHS